MVLYKMPIKVFKTLEIEGEKMSNFEHIERDLSQALVMWHTKDTKAVMFPDGTIVKGALSEKGMRGLAMTTWAEPETSEIRSFPSGEVYLIIRPGTSVAKATLSAPLSPVDEINGEDVGNPGVNVGPCSRMISEPSLSQHTHQPTIHIKNSTP